MTDINKIYNEDCLITMKRLDDKSVDNVITSPPYNVGYNNMHGKDITKYKLYDDSKNNEFYENWLYNVIDELLRVTKNHIFFNIQMLGNNKNTVLKLFGKYEKNIKDIIIWNKKIAPPHIEEGVMNSKFEFIIIFSNQNPEKKKFYDGKFKGNFNNVIDGLSASGNEYAKIHKATYPLYLPRTILQKFGEKNDIIYDPFMGTGTTALACLMENRKYIGSEIDTEYIKLINKRLNDYNSQIKLF